MPIFSIVLGAAALLFALVALLRASSLSRRVEQLSVDTHRRLRNMEKDTEPGGDDDLRRTVAALAAGNPMTAEMVMEGRLWGEVEGSEAKALVDAGGAHVLDVRTPGETAAGILPGALLIPLDQLEDRCDELPRDGQPFLVYCAMGMRSASACEFLSSQGFANLHNLGGGIGAWTGPTTNP